MYDELVNMFNEYAFETPAGDDPNYNRLNKNNTTVVLNYIKKNFTNSTKYDGDYYVNFGKDSCNFILYSGLAHSWSIEKVNNANNKKRDNIYNQLNNELNQYFDI
jgi:hypothetical protein